MTKPIDRTLYNQIKAGFSIGPEQISLIDLSVSDFDRPEARVSTHETYGEFSDAFSAIAENDVPYASFCTMHGRSNFVFGCEEFMQEEDLKTGRIVHFEARPFDQRKNFDLEKIKE